MKVNKIIAGIMAVCVMGFGVPYVNAIAENNSVIMASAADYTEGTYELLTYKNYGDYIEISKCDTSATEVIIPSEIEGVPVTSIGKSAFSVSYFSENILKSVEIPDSVTNIGDDAFYKCENLTSINIPAGVTHIGREAFEDCSSLESIEIPDGITIIEYGTFQRCKSLTSVKIPNSVTSIKVNAFEGCMNLESIEIPDSVTSIEGFAFSQCNSLKSVKIPDSVTSIGGMAFQSAPWLDEKRKENPLVIVNNILIDGRTCSGDVIIPNSVTSIADHAFDYSNLTSVKIPYGITSIEERTFYDCHNLISVEIPDSVMSIGKRAFEDCTSLTSIKIPDSVTSIENYAFCENDNLISIEIPESVTSLGESVFYKTAWLDEKRKENPLVIVNNFLVDGKTCTGDVVIPDGVTNIINMSFRENSNLISIEIPESVTIIGTYVFEDCS
ncbi:MAG: leucine-rich repeat domain-containing protein, partial [Ruminococcus sp.]|nr:leucine-rich repeat domain-containing protein [Ruminococcus sp.]